MIDCKIAGDYTNCKDEVTRSRVPPALSQGERTRLSIKEAKEDVGE